jgi:hypothetical protein
MPTGYDVEEDAARSSNVTSPWLAFLVVAAKRRSSAAE